MQWFPIVSAIPNSYSRSKTTQTSIAIDNQFILHVGIASGGPMHALMARLWTGQEFSQDIFPALGNFPGLGRALGRKKAWETPGKALGRKVVPLSDCFD